MAGMTVVARRGNSRLIDSIWNNYGDGNCNFQYRTTIFVTIRRGGQDILVLSKESEEGGWNLNALAHS